jgi:hypothetical protein
MNRNAQQHRLAKTWFDRIHPGGTSRNPEEPWPRVAEDFNATAGTANDRGDSNRTPRRGDPERKRNRVTEAPFHLRLGQLLLKAGRINRRQLSEALEEQQCSKERIGAILIEKGYVKPRDVALGLKLQSAHLTATLAAVLFLVSEFEALPVGAGSKSADFKITATVASRCRLTVLNQQTNLTIGAADLEKGYVDVPAATRFTVETNLKTGYSLMFEGLDWPFREVHILGLAPSVQINAPGGFVYQPYRKIPVTAVLSYRFILSEGAKIGTYAWPLALSVQPL